MDRHTERVSAKRHWTNGECTEESRTRKEVQYNQEHRKNITQLKKIIRKSEKGRTEGKRENMKKRRRGGRYSKIGQKNVRRKKRTDPMFRGFFMWLAMGQWQGRIERFNFCTDFDFLSIYYWDTQENREVNPKQKSFLPGQVKLCTRLGAQMKIRSCV